MKVLMYGNIYVDVNLLYKGIYEINEPTIYRDSDTIESLSNTYSKYVSTTAGENIKKCKLVQCEIVLKRTKTKFINNPKLEKEIGEFINRENVQLNITKDSKSFIIIINGFNYYYKKESNRNLDYEYLKSVLKLKTKYGL